MWLVTVLQGEGGSQVLLQQWSLLDFSQQSLVDDFLVFHTFSLDFLDLLFWEQVSFLLLLLGQFFLGKVFHVELGNVDGVDSNLSGSGNDVLGVDSSQWDTVDLEWTGDQQSVVFQMLQVDDSLTSETAG